MVFGYTIIDWKKVNFNGLQNTIRNHLRSLPANFVGCWMDCLSIKNKHTKRLQLVLFCKSIKNLGIRLVMSNFFLVCQACAHSLGLKSRATKAVVVVSLRQGCLG